MSQRDIATIERAIAILRAPSSLTQVTEVIWQLLDRYGSQLADMPSDAYEQVIAALTSDTYACLFEDTDAAITLDDSPLRLLYRAVERVIPATHISNIYDCQTAAVRVFQRLMERQASLGWQMVHPRVQSTAAPLTSSFIQDAFALQASMGQADHAVYPVIFSLNYPVLCSIQGLREDVHYGLRRQVFVSIVRSGFLRLTVLPWYMLGYDGYDSLVWLQKGFRVRVGGFQLPPNATALHEIAWQLTDYRLERRVAYHPETGAVMKHSARLLTR